MNLNSRKEIIAYFRTLAIGSITGFRTTYGYLFVVRGSNLSLEINTRIKSTTIFNRNVIVRG